jgi:AraC family transcriptional regulator
MAWRHRYRLSRNFIVNAGSSNRAGPRVGHPVSVAAGRLTLQLLPRAPYSARDPAHLSSIGVALERQSGVHAIGSDRRESFDRWPGTLALAPAGVDVFSESAMGGEYLVLRCETELAGDQTRVCFGGVRQAFSLARAIRRALLAPVFDATQAEDLAWRLAATGFAAQRAVRAGHADRTRYARVLARIADAFDQPLVIDELAKLAGQPPLAFLRGFTAAVGMTPHAYLTEQRLQAARRLLADARLTLSDIGLACGFSHQSHFGDAFKRTFGLTPAQYRRLLA